MRLLHLAEIFAAAACLVCQAPVSAANSATAPPCSARRLQAADAGTRRYVTRNVTRIEVINNSPGACTLRGYPQLRFLLFSGASPFVLLHKTPSDANYKTPGPTTIDLGSLQRASFLLGYPTMKARGNSCVPTSTIEITFGGPYRFGTVELPDTISSCGVVNVSPFFIFTGTNGASTGAVPGA